jgi:hypothetical protein
VLLKQHSSEEHAGVAVSTRINIPRNASPDQFEQIQAH